MTNIIENLKTNTRKKKAIQNHHKHAMTRANKLKKEPKNKKTKEQ